MSSNRFYCCYYFYETVLLLSIRNALRCRNYVFLQKDNENQALFNVLIENSYCKQYIVPKKYAFCSFERQREN